MPAESAKDGSTGHATVSPQNPEQAAGMLPSHENECCTAPILFTGTILFTALFCSYLLLLFTGYYLFTRSEPVVAAPILFTHISSSLLAFSCHKFLFF